MLEPEDLVAAALRKRDPPLGRRHGPPRRARDMRRRARLHRGVRSCPARGQAARRTRIRPPHAAPRAASCRRGTRAPPGGGGRLSGRLRLRRETARSSDIAIRCRASSSRPANIRRMASAKLGLLVSDTSVCEAQVLESDRRSSNPGVGSTADRRLEPGRPSRAPVARTGLVARSLRRRQRRPGMLERLLRGALDDEDLTDVALDLRETDVVTVSLVTSARVASSRHLSKLCCALARSSNASARAAPGGNSSARRSRIAALFASSPAGR